MDPAAILARYDAEMRADPPPETGIRYERLGIVLRATGVQNWIVFAPLAQLDPASVDAAIATQAAYFRSVGTEVEWKVYGHDRPADLGRRLGVAGFEPDEPETFMVFDLSDGPPQSTPPTGVVIRRVAGADGLADLIAVHREAFGRVGGAMAEALARRLGDPALGLYVAYAGEVPVASARLELPAGRSFAGLWGGGTIPGYRGRGIFRSLVAVRAEEARRRGYRYLTVDAADTSRPILARLGFVPLTRVTGWKLRPARG